MQRFITIVTLLLLVATSLIAGCTGEVYSYDNFIDDLLDSDASVQIGEVSDHQGIISPFLANTKNNIKVNGENVNVYEYDNEALADEDAVHIHPNGSGYTRIDETGEGYNVQWSMVGYPHFYKKGRIIVSYVDVSRGSDPTVNNLLVSILGKQFAGLPPSVTLGGRPEVLLRNKQEVSSEGFLRGFQVDEGVSDEQYWYPSHIVNVGDPILIVSGTIQNKHKENTWIDMWAEGYDKSGEQVAWTLDDAHLSGHILLNLETDEKGEFTIHLNYSEDVFVRFYANNYPVPPP